METVAIMKPQPNIVSVLIVNKSGIMKLSSFGCKGTPLESLF